MTDSAALLRMLEPTVRPVQTPGASKSPAPPLEQRPFESLLAEAHERGMADSPADSAPGAGPSASSGSLASGAAEAGAPEANASSRPLAPLHGLDQVENASLRQLMARGEAGAGTGIAPPLEQEREQKQ